MITSPLSSNMPSLLEARDLVKRFRVRQSWTTQTNVTALDQLSLQIGAGQTVARADTTLSRSSALSTTGAPESV